MSGDTGRSTQSDDVINSDTVGSPPLSEDVPRPTDAASPAQPRSAADPLPTSVLPTDAAHQNVFQQPLLRSRTGEWQSQPNEKDDSNSNSYCSSFDCSTPDSPDSDQQIFWNSIIGDFNDKKRREQQEQADEDGEHDGQQTTEETRKDTRELDAGESEEAHRESQHQRSQTRDDDESGEHDRRSPDGNRIVGDNDDENYDTDREQGGGTDEEHTDHGQNNDDPEEDTGDVIDEDDDRDERAASGEDGSQDEQKFSDKESGSGKRKNSIPEDEEQDDKEDMDEDDDEQKKKKRRKKRKRKSKTTQSDGTILRQGAEHNENGEKCDLKDEQAGRCSDVDLNCRDSMMSYLASSDVCQGQPNDCRIID